MRVSEDRLTAAYMLATRRQGTIYLGSALDLLQRMWQHREGVGSRFVARYGVTRLVWYEPFMLITEARAREYEMKKWRRDWKTKLIERANPHWEDLYPVLAGSVVRKPRPASHQFPDGDPTQSGRQSGT